MYIDEYSQPARGFVLQLTYVTSLSKIDIVGWYCIPVVLFLQKVPFC